MTMHHIERMAALMAEIDNLTAAQILRQMVNTIQFVHRNNGPELTTAVEFAIAASHVPDAKKVQDLLEKQEWDDVHMDAFMKAEELTVESATWLTMVIKDKDGAEYSGRDQRSAIEAYKDHKEALSVKAKADFLAGGWKTEAAPVV